MSNDCGILSTSLTEAAAVVVMIKAYNVTEKVTLGPDSVPRGTRHLLICDVEGLPEGNVVTNYTWYHSSTRSTRSEIQKGYLYYKSVNDTLLVDTTSWGDGKSWYICEVQYVSEEGRPRNQSRSTTRFSLTG